MTRTLHIDIEGGWGGSSRSLFELVSRLAPEGATPVIIVRKEGPIREKYEQLTIPVVHLPDLPTYLPRPGIAWADLIKAAPQLILSRQKAAREIAEVARVHKVQVVHFNHEGLMPLAASVKRLTGLPLVVHLRASSLGHDLPALWLSRVLARWADHLIFISPMEERWFRSLQPRASVASDVVWNISPEPLPRVPDPDVPDLVYLGNIDYLKGTDRLIDIAAALDRCGAPPARIAIYGMARQEAYYEAQMRERVSSMKLSHRIFFGGYIADPREVLARAFVLLRPSRRDDPWGRDVIEAVTAGVPVLATGTFSGIVRQEETGRLFSPFDAETMARYVDDLLRNRTYHARLREAAARFGRERFLGHQQVERMTAVFSGLVH